MVKRMLLVLGLCAPALARAGTPSAGTTTAAPAASTASVS